MFDDVIGILLNTMSSGEDDSVRDEGTSTNVQVDIVDSPEKTKQISWLVY